MHNRSHKGSGFEVWRCQRTWFWFVADPHHNRAAIGAAATESEAVHEACWSIEEMSAQRRACTATLWGTAESALLPVSHRSNSIALAWWEASLSNLERYLPCIHGATA